MKILTDTGLMVLWQRIKDLYKKISVSAKQTTTSTADGGTNVMTFTFGDGTSTTFSVKNGSKGSDGARGATGAKGDKGDKGDSFKYSDFTPDQLAALKGPKGDRGPVGETGPQGNSGIADASNKALINDAVTGGETSYLSAEVGKLGILTYDCSKGGTVEHASLQDAINAVPTTFRKVGITIIYKSGDSIYRYALKSNSWSTDSTNWFSVEEKVSDLSAKNGYPYGNVHLVGDGDNFIWSNKISVIQGNKYRIYVDKNININGIGKGIRFIVNSNKSFDNALVLKAYADSLEDYYDVVATSSTLFIGCRAAIGAVFSAYILDITIQSSNKDNIENQEVKLQSIEERIGSFFVVSLVENILISPDGSTTAAPSTRWGATDFISVNEGDRISFLGGSNNSCLGISSYNENKEFVPGASSNIVYTSETGSQEKLVSTIPSGVKYIRLCKDRKVLEGNTVEYVLNDIKETVDDIIKEVDDNIGESFNVGLTTNILISPDGSTAQAPSTYWGATDFISVNEGDYISFTGGGRNNCLAVSAYSSKSQDSILTSSSASKAYSSATDAVETIEIVVPSGVKFIRICKDRRVLSGNEIKVLKNALKSRLDSLDKEIEGIRKDVNTPKIYKYLYRMYSTDTRISTNWTRNAENIYSNGKLGLSNKLMFDYQFALSDRIFAFDFSVEAESKCHFCSWNDNKNIIGTDIIVDALNGNITLNGDGKPDIVETATMVSSHKFRLIIDRSSRLIKISLIDLLDYTKLCEFTTPNDARYYGYFNDKPMCYVESGNIYLYNLIVDYHHNQSNKYKLVIYGDSITEGYEAEDYTNGYAYRIANAVGNDRVKISARSSGTIENILARIDNELSNIRTDYVMVTIGTNGGNTIENLTQLINKIKEYGAIPIINHVPCDYYNTAQGIDEEELYLSRNRTIDEAILANGGNIDCVRMDVATAKDHIPANGANRSMFKDSIHPTDVGHELIFKQALIDCPYLFN